MDQRRWTLTVTQRARPALQRLQSVGASGRTHGVRLEADIRVVVRAACSRYPSILVQEPAALAVLCTPS